MPLGKYWRSSGVDPESWTLYVNTSALPWLGFGTRLGLSIRAVPGCARRSTKLDIPLVPHGIGERRWFLDSEPFFLQVTEEPFHGGVVEAVALP